MPPKNDPPAPEQKQRCRQRVMLAVLAALLAVGGIALALGLKKVPAPVRLLLGFGDLTAALLLLLALWQTRKTD